VHAEENEYREDVRKQKTKVYEQYLWRKVMRGAYSRQIDFMMSKQWETSYSATVKRYTFSLTFLIWRL
jgi:hypothetical protein